MSKAFVGRFLHGALLLGMAAGTAVAVSQTLSMQQDLTSLRQRLASVEKRPAATTTPTTSTTVVNLPSGDSVPASAGASSEIAELRRRLDAMAAKSDSTAVPAGLALPEALKTTPSADGSAPTVATADLPPAFKEAVKAVMKEAQDERDKQRTQDMVTRGSERMLDRLATELALSESQKDIIKKLLDDRSKKFAELWQGDLSREDRTAKMTEMRKEADTAIKQALTAEQGAKYDTISQDLGGFGGGRGGNGGSGGGGRGNRGGTGGGGTGGGGTGGGGTGGQPGGGSGGR